MKNIDIEEYKDKLLAYYGDEYALRNTRKRMLRGNVWILVFLAIFTIIFSFIFALLGGMNHFLFFTLCLSTMTVFPCVIGTVVNFFFIVLEEFGFGLAVASEIIFVFAYHFCRSTEIALIIAILLLIILCQYFSKQEFEKKVAKARYELSQHGINVEIINNRVIFK